VSGEPPGPTDRRAATQGDAIRIERRQLQSKFNRHAEDFGIEGRWSPENGRRYEAAIRRHVASGETRRVIGTYRGDPVIHYVDERTGIDVITTRSGRYISGWKLNPRQLQNVLTRGAL
jgi:hypothetical protein